MGLPTLRVSSRASSSACASTCFGEAPQEPGPVGGGDVTPAREGAPRPRSTAASASSAALAVDLGHGQLGGRVHDADGVGAPPVRSGSRRIGRSRHRVQQGPEGTAVAVFLGMPLHAHHEAGHGELHRFDATRPGARAVTTAPHPGGRGPGGASTAPMAVSPRNFATAEPASVVTTTSAKHPRAGWCRSSPTTSGTCWTSVPPRRTLSSCMPRQMARTGRSTSRAAREQRQLAGVAPGVDAGGGRMRRLPVPGRVDVPAAHEHERVERVDDVAAATTLEVHRVGRGEQHRASARGRPRCRRRRRAGRPPVVSHGPHDARWR